MTLTMNKVRKSFSKRFKISKKGKLLRRLAGQSHFLAKKPTKVLLRKKKLEPAPEFFEEYKNY